MLPKSFTPKYLLVVVFLVLSFSLSCRAPADSSGAAQPSPSVGGSPKPEETTVAGKAVSHKIVCSCSCPSGGGNSTPQTFDVPAGGDCGTLNGVVCDKSDKNRTLRGCGKESVPDDPRRAEEPRRLGNINDNTSTVKQ